jgi:hypothetical protein
MFALPRVLAAALFAAAVAAFATLPATESRADGPKDNIVDNVRPVPPKGNAVSPEDLEQIKKGLTELQQLIKDVGQHELLPDVQIFEKAVRWAIDYDEVFDGGAKGKGAKPGGAVKKVLAAGLERAKALKEGKTPWTTQTGGVLRGYKSKIDGSVQPYWLIVPADYDFKGKDKHRLDFWWHGRYENTVEAGFMANSPGTGGIIPAPGALILHPFGRFSNANKFAGEVDTFECLEHAKKHYRIDENRLVARGFSMGGAACWQYGAHYPCLWAACAPGAGFSETPEFLNVYQNEKIEPTWYEKKLWHLYNASDYALNFFDLPTVAYSGEIDRQKQAADVMEREMKKVGLKLTHVIGPKTAHAYEKNAKVEVNKLIDEIVAKGKPAMRKEIKFVTYTLRYNRCDWLEIDRLEKHWSEAVVTGTYKDGKVDLKTKGVVAFRLTLPAEPKKNDLVIDGESVWVQWRKVDGGFTTYVLKHQGTWGRDGTLGLDLLKKPGLQGPIDDAFMDSFVMVKPSGKPMNEAVGKWAEQELKHAVSHWRSQFRGDAPVKADTEITKDDIANNNLILWGDPKSNAVLAKLAALPDDWTHLGTKVSLPIKWTEKGVTVGDKTYEAGTHVPVLIYPNPLNPKKYVVLNSGFTFREYDYLNNARQVPKLPDYAVIDITTPANARYPGKVVRAGFFGEKWELLPDDGK